MKTSTELEKYGRQRLRDTPLKVNPSWPPKVGHPKLSESYMNDDSSNAPTQPKPNPSSPKTDSSRVTEERSK